MSSKDLEGNIGKNYSSFMKRCIVYDFNKSVLEHIFAKKSDYLVLDILDARHALLIKGDHCITLTNKVQEITSDIQEHFDLSGYKEYSPFNDISIEQWKDCICKLANEIRRHYVVNQIILNVHYGVTQYISEKKIKDFSAPVVNNVEQYNKLIKNLFGMLKTELKGCHVIEFPDYVMSIAGHKWGLTPLHYHDFYYDYAAQAIRVVLQDLPEEKEKEKLEQLRVNCSERFELLKTKRELEIVQKKTGWLSDALNFAEAHACDVYGNEKFSRWLSECKTKNKKVVVLDDKCAAGRILLKALKKYEINVIFSTAEAGFSRLSEERFLICREADIVITANVHSDILPEKEEVKAVSVWDILK